MADVVMLGEPLRSVDQLQGKQWIVSEKLDGQRCLYFHDQKKFYSRLQTEIKVPDQWMALFQEDLKQWCDNTHTVEPPPILDGELWCGRGNFQMTESIVRRTVNIEPERWLEHVKYMVFDLPHPTAMNGVWGNTWYKTKGWPDTWPNWLGWLAAMCPWNKVCHSVCWGPQEDLTQEAIDKQLSQVLNLGGEGLMLRDMNRAWLPRRGPWLLKVLPMHQDVVTVELIVPGERRGAIHVVNNEGKQFLVGTGCTDAEFDALRIGQEIKVGWRELTEAGVPKSARYLGQA